MYSTQRATSDGTLILLDISIDYLERENITVLFDSVQQAVGTTWDWVGTTDKRISFTPAVPAGVNVDVVRTSDLSEVRHLFAGGAAFLPETMDENFNHILQIAQEARERATLQDVFQNIDMHGFQLTNLAPGTIPGHAVEYSQLVAHDATIVGYMNTTLGYRDQAQTYRNQAEAFAQAAADSASAGIEALVIANDALAAATTAATEVGKKLDRAGGVLEAMTGPLILYGQATSDLEAIPKVQFDVTAPPSVRQTVLSGPVGLLGQSMFGGSTGGTSITASGTLVVTAAYGALNRTGRITNPSWTGLTTNGTMFLGLHIAADGTCTPFSTSLAPVYQFGGDYSTIAGQYVFNIQEARMGVGNGVSIGLGGYSVFVGEVTVLGGVVTAITWYALMGRYFSADTAVPGSGVKTNFNHNIGCQFGVDGKVDLICQTAQYGWVAGEIAQNALGYFQPGTYVSSTPPVGVDSRNTASVTTGSGSGGFIIINKSTGALVNITPSNWKMRVSIRRGW